MHNVIISVGSNYLAEENLDNAIKSLIKIFPNIRFSPVIETTPYGALYKNNFLNTLGWFTTEQDCEYIYNSLKCIEKEMGRKKDDKLIGKIIIDIDLIKTDNQILKPKDFERDYVNKLINYVSFN